MLRYKEDIITLLVVVTTLLFFVLSPEKATLGVVIQGFITALIFFGLLPIGYHFLVLKKKRETFGLESDAWRNQIIILAPLVTLALIITVACHRFFPGFQQGFVLPGIVQTSFGWFIGYELLLVPIIAALYEIFFRGLIQKSWLEKHFGALAIVIQSIIFALFFLITGSLNWGTFPIVLFSLFSGFIVWRNNSLLQAWVASWLYFLLFDVFVLITT